MEAKRKIQVKPVLPADILYAVHISLYTRGSQNGLSNIFCLYNSFLWESRLHLVNILSHIVVVAAGLLDSNFTVDSKMAEIDVQLKQLAVTEFWVGEGEKPTCIHRYLFCVYGEATVDEYCLTMGKMDQRS